MKPLEEQIFDRRCQSAKDGDEASVRFYDELLGEFEELRDSKQGLEEELAGWQDAPCEDCVELEQKISDLKKQLIQLDGEYGILEKEISLLQDQIQHDQT